MGDGVLTRDFILTSELAGLDIGGAHYVPQYAFLETGSQTTDQDLATLMLKSLMLLRSRFSGHSRVEVEFIDGRSSIEPFEFIRRYFPWQRDLYEDLSDANSTGRA